MDRRQLIYEASYPISEHDPVTMVKVANPMKNAGERDWIEVNAKWDTGASICAITRRVADMMKLDTRLELGMTSFASATAVWESADMVLLKLIQGPYAILALSYVVDAIPGQCDMLIGMNVISAGRFSLTVNPPNIDLRLEIFPGFKYLRKVKK